MQVHREDKSIHFKIVYHGPALCGKTTNLMEIFNRVRPEQRLSPSVLEIPTKEDKTLTYDIMPLTMGNIKGYTPVFSIYTVPGQVYYKNSRRMILQDVDGVVFVADSQPEMREANIEILKELNDYLKEQNSSDTVQVFQFNKRDLSDVMDVETMKRDLIGAGGAPYFEAAAIEGDGVMETLQTILKLTVANHYPK